MDQKEIAIIGRISASMTHEVRNILAIIRESSGLMQDILALSKGTPFPEREKFANALGKIEKHVRRGDEIVTQFNAFAHSMDEPRDWIEVMEMVNQVVILMNRFARSKEVTLTVESLDKAPAVYTHPIRLMLVLAECIEQLVEQGSFGDEIVFRPAQDKENAVIEILAKRASGQAGPLPCDWSHVSGVINELNGDLQPVTEGQHPGLRLALPLK